VRWPVQFRSILVRTMVLNAMGFAVVFFGVFLLMDYLYRQSLMDRLDDRLQSELLVLTSELDSQIQNSDKADIEQIIQRYSLAYGIAEVFIQVLDENGRALVRSDARFWPGLERQVPPPRSDLEHGFVWDTLTLGDSRTRVISYLNPENHLYQMGWSLRSLHEQLVAHRAIFGIGFFAIWVLGTSFVWLVTHQGLRGVRVMTRAARTIREKGELSFRVSNQTGSLETDQLASTFNDMLDQIQSLIQNLRTVMDNIAHDIKTPITRLLGIADQRLRKNRTEDLELAGHVVEECDQIMNIIRSLLDITAAESGLSKWHIEPLDLVALVGEACELFEPLIQQKALTLVQDFPETLRVSSDLRALQRIIGNLLDNAIKFTPEGGKIEIRIEAKDHQGYVSIEDSGIGIHPLDLPHIFQRFHRGELARDLPGNGLGLSFCASALKALKGSITCESTPGVGTRFVVRLPLAGSQGGGDPGESSDRAT